jgi:crotonobetainyl-CoA:carnitine CoA-transferase CaiB-like acyl-CoA transferase
MSEGPLAGLRVLEYCRLVSGPYCTKLLADLGAEVIKIEEPGAGDPARAIGPFPGDLPHPERSGLFLYLNTNKLGITLSLKGTAGRRIFKELLKAMDVLVEDSPPGTMEEMGLDYQSLSQALPGLIMTSITPFGQTGPYKDYKAYPLTTFHASGQGYHMQGLGGEKYLDREPIKVGGLVGEYDPGMNAAVAILGAVYGRELTGQGQHIDISKQESLLALLRVEAALYANHDVEAAGSRGGLKRMPGGMVRCQDGYVATTTPLEHQWQALVKLLGSPEWAEEEWARDRATRTQHVAKLDPLIGEGMAHRTKQELYHAGQALSCPIAPVESAQDIAQSPQLDARGFFAEVEHPQAGRLRYATTPYQFSETPGRLARPAPLLGEHNELIYWGRLGYSREELVRLRQAAVI